MSRLEAVLFDVDGTLIDSNDLHIAAWVEALRHFGVPVTEAAMAEQIGKGGDQLLPVFIGGTRWEPLQQEIESFRGDLYAREYLPRIKPFPGVRRLMERLRADGRRIVLASSGKSHEVEHAEAVLGIGDLVDARTTADDVERSKPKPDIFRAALDKLPGVEPGAAIAVGDTPYDAKAAAGAGVRTIGVLSGGFPREALEAAGCVAIYDDVQGLLADYDGSPLAG